MLLDGPCFRFLKLKRFVGRKKNICIFGARMFAVYVEASIGSCCFIPVRHRVRNSFMLFRAQCGKACRLYNYAISFILFEDKITVKFPDMKTFFPTGSIIINCSSVSSRLRRIIVEGCYLRTHQQVAHVSQYECQQNQEL